MTDLQLALGDEHNASTPLDFNYFFELTLCVLGAMVGHVESFVLFYQRHLVYSNLYMKINFLSGYEQQQQNSRK